jgi:hypothetical protein
MKRLGPRSLLLLLALGLVALPASAELYTLTLKNGNTFLSRQQPQFASWDQNVVLVLSDVGNWVAFEAQDVASVTSETQVRGFAVRLNATTLFLGWSANDGTGERGGVMAPQPTRSYDQQQFVDPSEAGGGFPTTSTMPGSYGTYDAPTTPPPAPSAPASPPAEDTPQQ